MFLRVDPTRRCYLLQDLNGAGWSDRRRAEHGAQLPASGTTRSLSAPSWNAIIHPIQGVRITQRSTLTPTRAQRPCPESVPVCTGPTDRGQLPVSRVLSRKPRLRTLPHAASGTSFAWRVRRTRRQRHPVTALSADRTRIRARPETGDRVRRGRLIYRGGESLRGSRSRRRVTSWRGAEAVSLSLTGSRGIGFPRVSGWPRGTGCGRRPL